MKFDEMIADDLRAVNRQQTVVMLPIAACEQHGPHLPTSTDVIICEAVARGVERRLADRLLLLPTLWLGASQHHLPWGATLTARLETHITLLCEIIEPLLDDRYRRIMLLNGHGGNIDPMRVALRRLQSRYPDVLLAAGSYWIIAEQEIASIMEGENKTIGHAGEAETSLVMHLRPELVRTEAIEPTPGTLDDCVQGMFICRDMAQRTAKGATGLPNLASDEKGAALLEAIVPRVEEAAATVLNEPLPERVDHRIRCSIKGS